MSADITGSTRLKQQRQLSSSSDAESNDAVLGERLSENRWLSRFRPLWFTTIESFFIDFRRIFANELKISKDQAFRILKQRRIDDDTAKKHIGYETLNLEIWKTIGDEIVFVAEVTDADQVALLAFAFQKSIIYFRGIAHQKLELDEDSMRKFYEEIQESRTYKEANIDVKGAIWSAGFPATNKEIISFRSGFDEEDKFYGERNPTIVNFLLLERWLRGGEERNKLTRDFIGPSIDTGFRIAGLASPKKLTLSLDITYLVSISDLGNYWRNEIALYFDERINLKGVLGGDPYPLFWIDSSYPDGLAQKESKISSDRKKADFSDISEFCSEFYDQYAKYIHPPKILDDHHTALSGLPSDHLEFLENLDEIWRTERSRISSFTKDLD